MLKQKTNSIFQKLEAELEGRTIIVGMGNTLRQDDGFGCCLAQKLKNKIRLKVLDVGSVLENFFGEIIKENPKTVLLIDALDSRNSVGELSLLNSEELKTSNFFLSHNISPSLLFDFLKENTNAKLYLLAIQPKAIGFGEEMTFKIKERLEELRNWFLDKYPI
ncbi:MAG: hydrogenase maturation protease [Candidatus Omnitrophota bacterium]|nr:hydrogenase maturation protease [Candidatus Omnitrophota bacterium]